MKPVTILLALILFGGIESAAQTITFKFKPPTEGMTRNTESGYAFNLAMAVDMGGQVNTMELSNKKNEVRKETILSMLDGKATKIRATWNSYEEEDSSPMGGGRGGRGGRQRPKPEVNVAYIVERADTNVTVTREDGGEVSAEVRRFFKEDYGQSVLDDRISRFLDGRPVKLNEPIPLDKELAASFMGRMRGQAELKEFTLTLIGKRNEGGTDCAVFHLKMAATMNQGPMVSDLKLEGDVLIDPATAWPVILTLNGPVTMSSANPDMNVSGDGTFGGTKKWSYGE